MKKCIYTSPITFLRFSEPLSHDVPLRSVSLSIIWINEIGKLKDSTIFHFASFLLLQIVNWLWLPYNHHSTKLRITFIRLYYRKPCSALPIISYPTAYFQAKRNKSGFSAVQNELQTEPWTSQLNRSVTVEMMYKLTFYWLYDIYCCQNSIW